MEKDSVLKRSKEFLRITIELTLLYMLMRPVRLLAPLDFCLLF